MRARKFTVHVNGHPGHHGNVLAFAFLERVRALLGALAHAERNFLGVPNRLTEYEITNAAKVNPTELTLVPVATIKNYDPVPTLDWTFDQIERIARGDVVDDRVDEALAKDFIKVVPLDHHIGATGIWITAGDLRVNFDNNFKANSEAIAHLRRLTMTKPQWAVTRSHGSVTGVLSQVDDWEGKAEFSIKPPIGADKIKCKFPDNLRGKVQESLFQTARFSGILYYGAESPFPYLVEVDAIEPITPPHEAARLSELRGLFEGRPRIADETGDVFRGL